ncbi:MAG: leucyl aminopeptidase family protein [Rhodobacteraceae bacterium]|nr:MAG: leucyl aminopeptidase family protein [Paracoccaceae bacterium]
MSPRFAHADEPAIDIHLIEEQDLEAAREALTPAARAWIDAQGFRAKLGQVVALPLPDGGVDAVLVGWGDHAARRRERFHLAGAPLPPGVYRLETDLPPDSAEEQALGWLLGQYVFDRYKKADRPERRLVAPASVDAARVEAIAAGVFFARDLVNTPANALGPAALEDAAREIAFRHGDRITVTTGDALIEAGLPLIHAVGRAGREAPRLIDIAWGPHDGPKVTIVGKGVCFDTGGLDLKPSSAMRLMKKDMGGAAAALGLAEIVMERRLPISLRVLIPAVENAIGPDAFRPGDILTSRKRLTVEVGNTDAEGRLILADALTLAAEEEPDLLIDFATLTGAARVALGPDLPALFTDDEALAADLLTAGVAARDPLWRLPLWDGYDADISSPVADLDNAPAGGMAGAITAALFLRRFAAGAKAWAHVDLYAWNPKAKPGRPAGGELQAARAVFAMLERRHG